MLRRIEARPLLNGTFHKRAMRHARTWLRSMRLNADWKFPSHLWGRDVSRLHAWVWARTPSLMAVMAVLIEMRTMRR